jgi:hypothetical protein
MEKRGVDRLRWRPGKRARPNAGLGANRLLRLEAITETALSHLDLDELLERIRDLLESDTAVLLLVDDEGEALVVGCGTLSRSALGTRRT